MDRKAFRMWLSEIDELTEARKLDVADVLAGREIGGAARVAIEVSVGEERSCPHCVTPGAVRRGTARGLRRYQCNACEELQRIDDNAVVRSVVQGTLAGFRPGDGGWRMATRCGLLPYAVASPLATRH